MKINNMAMKYRMETSENLGRKFWKAEPKEVLSPRLRVSSGPSSWLPTSFYPSLRIWGDSSRHIGSSVIK